MQKIVENVEKIQNLSNYLTKCSRFINLIKIIVIRDTKMPVHE